MHLLLAYKSMSDRHGDATITFTMDQENFQKACALAAGAGKKLLKVTIEEAEQEVFGRKAE